MSSEPPPVKPCLGMCAGTHGCDWANEGGPCWGQVHMVETYPGYTMDGPHACEGHDEMIEGRSYRPPPEEGERP